MGEEVVAEEENDPPEEEPPPPPPPPFKVSGIFGGTTVSSGGLQRERHSRAPLIIPALSTAATLRLAFQSVGVVYGDIGTSPLYVFSSTFAGWEPSHGDLLGALSLIIYSLTLFPLLKYVFIVLHANDNGDGGTFAMYSLICRHCNVGAVPAVEAEEVELPAGNPPGTGEHLQRAERIKRAMEGSPWAKACLLTVALLGTCMVVGDGILTPCISVLSAVDGVKKVDTSLSREAVVMISVGILVVLFSVQRLGTDKVGYAFAPAILIWYCFICAAGVSNLVRHDSSVLKAFNPAHAFIYFKRDPKRAWVSMGGIVLCMTGTEAMFADLGHFSVRSIQIAFAGLVYPCLISAYVGQAAYLCEFPGHAGDAFYKSTPESAYWPMFAAAVMASIIASQAMISATFAIVKQSVALGCFPRVRVVHTSRRHEGQVYIPEVNFLLMAACVTVTAAFKETTKIGNAYGIAVVAVMIVTTSLMTLVMLVVWRTALALVAAFVLVFGSLELFYFSAVLYKFDKGGYLPLSVAAVLFFVMYIWHYIQTRRYAFEVEQKVPEQYLSSLGGAAINRVPGVGLLYTELAQGVPAIFRHFLANLPAVHSVLVFVSVKHLAVSRVPGGERFLLRRVGLKDHRMYRCIVRYGYRDRRLGNVEFESRLMDQLRSFIAAETQPPEDEESWGGGDQAAAEVRQLEESLGAGVVYLLGHSEVRTSEDSSLLKRLVVDYVYDFLKRNSRQGFEDLQIPNKNMLQVGMNYYI
ncbi:unnamed protein product [Spirodela intermedia]|uniref:Potassium transporter n=1 Tax=Spirodela intermedia TaxID=51605 RepID=A0A7I8KEG6_SPIIN|nr:unnamed protein product [Spirodela intermedia]